MVKNNAFLIRKYGFVITGNRTYYTSRSQPPVFALLVRLLSQKKGNSALFRYLPYLHAEYAFWMKGARSLKSSRIAARRTVRLADGEILNRYFDEKNVPRPEGYKEDVEIALEAPDRTPSRVYLDLRAAAESGWDFSSRWLRDPHQLSSIHTTDIIPIDLNCLLYLLEQTIADAHDALKNKWQARQYRHRAQQRADAINKYCWNEQKGFYFDYDFVAKKQTDIESIAGAFPLFAGIATPAQAQTAAATIQKKFLKSGGLITTTAQSDQQWDAPNGWAPLHWVTIQGLRKYDHKMLAAEIKKRWVTTILSRYKETGKLVEKYNVLELHKPAGGGERDV